MKNIIWTLKFFFWRIPRDYAKDELIFCINYFESKCENIPDENPMQILDEEYILLNDDIDQAGLGDEYTHFHLT